jgi:hypothetical protein
MIGFPSTMSIYMHLSHGYSCNVEDDSHRCCPRLKPSVQAREIGMERLLRVSTCPHPCNTMTEFLLMTNICELGLAMSLEEMQGIFKPVSILDSPK